MSSVKRYIRRQMATTNSVVNTLSLIDDGVIVAGDGPRDWALGSKADQVNIYVRSVHKSFYSRLAVLVHLFSHNSVVSLSGEDCTFKVVVSGVLFNITFVSPETNTQNISSLLPTDLCNVRYEDGCLVKSEEFNKALSSGVVGYNKAFIGAEQLDRISNKFCLKFVFSPYSENSNDSHECLLYEHYV